MVFQLYGQLRFCVIFEHNIKYMIEAALAYNLTAHTQDIIKQ